MPRGVYERRTKAKQIGDRLRALADEIEAELTQVDDLKDALRYALDTVEPRTTKTRKAQEDKLK